MSSTEEVRASITAKVQAYEDDQDNYQGTVDLTEPKAGDDAGDEGDDHEDAD